MDRRAFFGLMLIETMLAFGSTFAASFNIIYLFNEFDMPLWYGPMYLLLGFGISALATLWMSWRPRVNPRNAMMFGLSWLCIEYSLFLIIHDGWLLGVVVGLAFGLYYPFFWTPVNVLMAKMTDKGDRGVTYGAFFFVWPLAAFVAPFLGGLVIGFLDYSFLFVMGIVIIASTIGVVFAYRNYMPGDQTMRIKVEALGRRNVVALLGEGGYEGIFWIDLTLVTYVFTQDEMAIGALFSLFGLCAGVMGMILGKVSDRIQNRVFFLRVSALASIPCVIAVSYATSIEQFALTNGILEVACFVLPVFLFAILTDKLENAKNDSVVGREFFLDVGRVVTISILMGLLWLGFTPQECFLLCIPFLLLSLVAHEERKAKPSVDVVPVTEHHRGA
ncbi:MAG: MFS transporter [Methanobacteriota archaeon]|nr:MAG: MFS transporter [Euryarchaeota archaeon]